jgi:HdeA/HdeB family
MPISSKKMTAGARVTVTAISLIAALSSAAFAATELKDNVDAKGYVNVKTLTCADLAGTYQEDANFLGVWYSGYLNGRAKKHSFNLEKTEAGIKAVVTYCQANPTKTLPQAADAVLK